MGAVLPASQRGLAIPAILAGGNFVLSTQERKKRVTAELLEGRLRKFANKLLLGKVFVSVASGRGSYLEGLI